MMFRNMIMKCNQIRSVKIRMMQITFVFACSMIIMYNMQRLNKFVNHSKDLFREILINLFNYL